MLVIILVGGGGGNPRSAMQAQAQQSVAQLRTDLNSRYTIVPLQRGVALVPRATGSTFKMIEIADGVVSVDGEALTGRQLTEKLGAGAPLVLQVSYLDAAAQSELSGGAASGSPAPSAAAAAPARSPDSITRTQVRNGDVVRFGGDVTVTRDERVIGDVVSIFGSGDVDGEITGDVAVIMGPLKLGPNAVVRGDVAAVGGSLTRDPGAQVFGKVDEVGIGDRVGRRGGFGGFRRGRVMPDLFGSFWSRAGSFAATALRLTLLILLGLAGVALLRTPVERIAARIATSPVRAGLIGLLAEVLFIPVLVLTVVVLAVSIIGIPLLALVPFGVVLVVLLMLVGFIGLAYQVGTYLLGRFGWPDRGAYATVTVGVLAVGAVTLIARLASLAGGFLIGAPISAVGYLVEYIAWTIGFGATILTWFETQRGTRLAAPTVPPAAPAQP
ncbi:MAG TPA: polymer-forming cytoskeletal protein [Roseiflexaceae bacterium]